ncbi:MAG: DNA repair protein RadA [Myxococcales bacterium]|nr:DNA repair protein RadA [Myxococcales bacterium]
MAKAKTSWVCSACGARFPRWMGRCGTCGEWSTLEEEVARAAPSAGSKERTGASGAIRIGEVSTDDAPRLPTGIGELDRALGGGPVRGGVVLLGGDPGIGKSTLLMQALAGLAGKGRSVLYVTGEESASQVALRARRIGGPAMDDVLLLATTELEDAEGALSREKPEVAVIDSIQALRASSLASAPGSVSQLREVAARLVDVAKRHGIALFLIGHVTKEGTLAGPKVLEHLVDTVLSFEGDRSHAFRMVRATKNRFGPAHEVGVFEMDRDGLREVPDPSALFLAERPANAAGSVVVPTAEGTRPLLVELQALVAPALYGAARRVVSGVDGNRLAILLAVLDRKAEVRVLDRDVFASVAGGARVDEPALDLALALAVVSSFRQKPLAPTLAVFGEVGLAGEVRAVSRPGPRLMEAKKLGFEVVVLPAANATRLTPAERKGLRLVPVSSLAEALDATLAG